MMMIMKCLSLWCVWCTPLIAASSKGRFEVVTLLINRRANINAQNHEGHNALYYVQQGKHNDAIIAVFVEEAKWHRVTNFVVFLHTGGLSSADWSVRKLGGGSGSMPAVDGPAATHPHVPSLSSSLISRPGRKVLENRDLCRIVTSYIAK